MREYIIQVKISSTRIKSLNIRNRDGRVIRHPIDRQTRRKNVSSFFILIRNLFPRISDLIISSGRIEPRFVLPPGGECDRLAICTIYTSLRDIAVTKMIKANVSRFTGLTKYELSKRVYCGYESETDG